MVSFQAHLRHRTEAPHSTDTADTAIRNSRKNLSAGDGPVDAAFLATERITGMTLVCKDFQVRSATLGHDAQGEVNLEVEHNGQAYRGRGVSTDSVEASILAILNTVNRITSDQANATPPTP